jgi:hypothetical protein
VKNESVILELQRATHVTLHRLAAELVDLDLTASEVNALGNLAEGDAPVTATPAPRARRGLTPRGPRPGDRRAVLIELTADGRTAAALILRTLREIEERAFADLPSDAVAGARAVLRALAQAGR